MKNVLNLVLFNIGWWACVLTAARGSCWMGLACIAVLLVLHGVFLRPKRDEWLLLGVCAVIGAVIEGSLSGLGLVVAPCGVAGSWLPALWLVGMWVNFGTSLRHSLAWMDGRPVLSSLFGALGGPLAYYGGARLGALEFSEPIGMGIVAVGLAWALAMPFLYWVSQQLARRELPPGSVVGNES